MRVAVVFFGFEYLDAVSTLRLVTSMVVTMLSWRPRSRAATISRPALAAATILPRKPKMLRMATAKLGPLPIVILLALMAPAAAERDSPEGWTCVRWLDAREHHRSKNVETWLEGYLTSSNQWALALGWAEAPLLVPEVLNLLDHNCRSTPNAAVTDVLDVIQSEFLRANWRDGK